MTLFTEINEAYTTRKEQEKNLLMGTKSLKAFEITANVNTLEGVQKVQKLFKGTHPKEAIKKANEYFNTKGFKVWEIKTVVAPNKNKDYVAYPVFNNTNILR